MRSNEYQKERKDGFFAFFSKESLGGAK